MQKWEYRQLRATLDGTTAKWIYKHDGAQIHSNGVTQILNEWGSEGWELVGISSHISTIHEEGRFYSLPYTDEYSYFFKRPKP